MQGRRDPEARGVIAPSRFWQINLISITGDRLCPFHCYSPYPGFRYLPASWDVCITETVRQTVGGPQLSLISITCQILNLKIICQIDNSFTDFIWTVTETEAKKVVLENTREIAIYKKKWIYFRSVFGIFKNHCVSPYHHPCSLKKLVNIMKTIHLNTGNGNVVTFFSSGNKLNWMYFRWVLAMCNQCPLCEATLPPL